MRRLRMDHEEHAAVSVRLTGPLRLAALIFTIAFMPRARADYPIASHRYLADPASLVHDGRVYLYCSNDDDNPVTGGYSMKSLVCVSSSDLKNWTDHGVVFRVPDDASWAGYAWAPAVVERWGKFFLYFGNNAAGVGVASSASPTGPFADARGGYLVNSNTPGVLPATNMWIFDPAVFVDDDDQAYLYFGGDGPSNARVIKLNSDMTSTSGAAASITTPNFFEASWMHKRNGLYYFSYSSNPSSGLTIDYMTSSSPMSGFTYRGTLAGQPPSNSNNNHHAIFSLNNAWYFAYHNRAVATQAGIPTTYRRNLGLETLEYNPDGTIRPIVFTTDGLAQLGNVDPYVREEAETFNAQSGISTEPCASGGMDVRYAQDGAWTKIRGVDFGSTGAVAFNAGVASAGNGGSIEIHLGDPGGTLVGRLVILGSGGLQNWSTESCPVSGAAGVHDVVLKFAAGNSAGMSLDWWRFDPMAPFITSQPIDKDIFPGSPLDLSVEAAGVGTMFQWYRDGAALAGQTQSALQIPNASAADSGAYSVAITNAGGTATSRVATVRVGPDACRLVNLSCRMQLNAGQMLTTGFFLAGTGAKRVLIRAAGPALATDFGLSGAMPNPQLRVLHGDTVIAQNDDWDAGGIGDAFARVGAFGFDSGSHDAAVLATLDSGTGYTVQISGADANGGIVLAELYDADSPPVTSRFINMSVRAESGTGAASLIVGFVLSGSGQRTLLIRGAGPGLVPFGVTDALSDPQLMLFDADSRFLQANYGWATSESANALTAAEDRVGAFRFSDGSQDAAMLSVAGASLRSVQVTSASNSTGEALAEIYEVP